MGEQLKLDPPVVCDQKALGPGYLGCLLEFLYVLTKNYQQIYLIKNNTQFG